MNTANTSPVEQWRKERMNAGKPFCRVALPSGSLKEATLANLRKAGYAMDAAPRALRAETSADPEIQFDFYRAAEIPGIVAQDFADIGITGNDMLQETLLRREAFRAQLFDVATFEYAKKNGGAWWILGVDADSPFKTPRDLRGGRVESEIPCITERFLQESDIPVRIASSFERGAEIVFPEGIVVVPSAGATEAKARRIGEGIVTLTETGQSVTANNLRVIGNLLRTNVALILNAEARKRGWGAKAKEIATGMLETGGVPGTLNEGFDCGPSRLV